LDLRCRIVERLGEPRAVCLHRGRDDLPQIAQPHWHQSTPGPLLAKPGGSFAIRAGRPTTLERNRLSERAFRTILQLARPTLLTKGSCPFAGKSSPALCQPSRPGPLSANRPEGFAANPKASRPLQRFLNDPRLRPTILERSLNDSRPGSTIPTILERSPRPNQRKSNAPSTHGELIVCFMTNLGARICALATGHPHGQLRPVPRVADNPVPYKVQNP